MIDNRRELLTYDISSFKTSNTKKLRNSHISLFKVALRSFERGDFDTAFELFNKLASDTFLPKEARDKVLQNKKDIEIIIEKGISEKDQKDIDPEFLEKLEKKRKKGDSTQTKITPDDEPVLTEEEIKEKVDSSNFYPIIKTAMSTFAEKLATTLGEVINGKLTKKEIEKDKSEIDQKSLEELDKSDVIKDVELSTESLENFTNIDTEGSIQDIYKKEFKSDLTDYKQKKELTEEDIQRFLQVGTQLSKTVPNFVESVNEMKESLDTISKEVPEFSEISKNIKDSLQEIQQSTKNHDLEKLKQDELSDDEEIIEKLKQEEQIKQSDIFKEDLTDLSKRDKEPTEEDIEELIEKLKQEEQIKQNNLIKQDVTDFLDKEKKQYKEDIEEIIDKLSQKYQQIDDRIKHIESAEFQRQGYEELEKLFPSEEQKKSKADMQNSLLEEISDKFEKLSSKVEELKEETEDTKQAKKELDNLNQKLKSKLEKEFTDYSSDSIEENINALDKIFEKETEEEIKEEQNEGKDLISDLDRKYSSIDEQLKQLQLNEEEILNQFGIDKGKLEERKEQKLSEKLKKAKQEEITSEDLESLLSDDVRKQNIPISHLSDEELNKLLMEDLNQQTEEYSKEEETETFDKEEHTGDLKHKLKEQLEEDELQSTKERAELRDNFIRENASEISKILRNNLEKISSLGDDSQYDIETLKKELNLKDDNYDLQMPPVNEKDIELPAGEENKYTTMDPIKIDGNLQNLMKITLSGKSNKYVEKLLDIENQISDLMESGDTEGAEDLASKLNKIKTHEKLEEISKDIEKEMVINYTSTQESKNIESIPHDKDLHPTEEKEETEEAETTPTQEIPSEVTEESTEYGIDKDISESEKPEFSENMLPITKKFYTNQESLANILDKLTNVLENSLDRLVKQSAGKEKESPQDTAETLEKGIESGYDKHEPKLKEKDKKKEKPEEEDYAFIAKEEERKKKGKEEPEFKAKEEEEDEFVAKEEVVYKKEPKKVIPQELLEEQILEKEKEFQMESYPDLTPRKDRIEEKEFTTLDDILDEEPYEGEEFTIEDLEKEERKQKVNIPGVDNHFMPGAYIPIDEYKNDDGFFTDIEGNPILLPEEEEPEEEEEFIEEDEFSIERPPDEEDEDEDEIIDIPEEITKDKKKIEPLKLTFDFKDMFHNKIYLKYRDILNEAAQLVSEKKLDQALEYYYIILDQNIPKAFRLMIQQNIDDITKTIIDTFKRSDTIVNVKSSGEITRLKTRFIKEEESDEEEEV